MLARLSAFAAQVSAAPDLHAACAAAAAAAGDTLGHRLFTVMRCDLDAMTVQRVWSSNPSAYPPGGIKKKRQSAWGDQVLLQGRPLIGHSADDIRAHFADHELIIGLGLESVLNMPIRCAGRTVGTMNLLHEADHYDDDHLEAARVLAALLAGPLLAHAPAAPEETGR